MIDFIDHKLHTTELFHICVNSFSRFPLSLFLCIESLKPRRIKMLTFLQMTRITTTLVGFTIILADGVGSTHLSFVSADFEDLPCLPLPERL
jgi:hypothetical protein